MTTLAFFVLGVYTLALLYITIYCVMQFNLLYYYKRGRRNTPEMIMAEHEQPVQVAVAAGGDSWSSGAGQMTAFAEEDTDAYPFVTVQLPIYNEMYVIERLIDAVAEFDYPKDRYEIHILDDSTDETLDIVAAKVAEYKAKGYNIEQVTREIRQGFKAGALRDGMSAAKGEFMAIFDADFLPKKDFLLRTLPFFQDEKVGVVQTRWEHINEDYSLITRLQALQLNVHFTVEQVGRMNGEYMLQFNGTAGVWRRKTIEDAGGWEADTLTEDLDLSIRSQLKGYKIRFLENIGSPAELPAEMNSFKSQQFRWMKGGAETAKKMLPTVWRSDLSLNQKVHATSHLLASSVFLFVFLAGISSVPLLFFMGDLIEMGFSKNFFAYFLVGLLSIIAIYYVANIQSPANQEKDFGKAVTKFILLFPLFLALSMGLSLHNSVAVLQGYRGKKSPFIRTPKFNIKNITDSFKKQNYLTKKLTWTTIGEGLLSLYFIAAVGGAFYIQNTTFVMFHLMLALGFGAIFVYSVKHLRLQFFIDLVSERTNIFHLLFQKKSKRKTMKKEFAFTLFSLFFVLFFSSCTENKNSDDVVTFWVNSSRAECSAGAGLKQCLQVYKGDDPSSGEWEFFYEEIKGFEFESGYFQKLEVKKTTREKGKVPMDASTLEYTLIKVLKKMEDPLFALGGKWMATSIAGKELTDETTMPVLQVDLAKMMIAGSNGCNNYNGGINTLTESAIELGNIASTKKMCMDMSIPDSYDQALNNTATYKMTDGELAFMGKDGATIVSFIKAEQYKNCRNENVFKVVKEFCYCKNP